MCHWLVVGGGHADVEVFVWPRGAGRHGWCLFLGASGMASYRRGLRLLLAARAVLMVSLAGGAGRGQTDVEALVCPQQSGRHCSCHWRVVCEGGGQTDVDAFVCSQRPGRHCMCLRPVVGGSRLTSRPSSTLGGPGRHCLCHWLVVSEMAN